MALVISEEWENEATRINNAAPKGWCAVLGVEPNATFEAVKDAFETAKRRLVNRQSIKNVAVQRAKQVLEGVWAQVGDASLLLALQQRERALKESKLNAAAALEVVRQRTVELEQRVTKLRQQQQMLTQQVTAP